MAIIRYTAKNPCPICGGHPGLPKGQGTRCAGFLSEGEEWVGCTREQFSGHLALNEKAKPPAFLHRLVGDCGCGERHDQRPPAPRPSTKAAKEEQLGPIVETYDYRYLDWLLVYQVTRHDPKDFRQRHPCPVKGGDWTATLGGNSKQCSCPKIDRFPYHLPELLTSDPGSTVYIVEGEKDADRLQNLDLVATCNSGGANSWESRYSKWFLGREVVVLPDNDEPGYNHGQHVAQMLKGKAGSVKVLDLPDLPPNGGDVSNWLDQGGTAFELERLAGNAKEWEPENLNSGDSGDSVGLWENPQDFASVVVPAFPVEALPPDLAKFVVQESTSKQVPQDLPGCLVLGALAAVSTDKCGISLAEDWIEPLNNYFIAVLPSGERKSPIFRDVFAPVEEIERRLVEDKKGMIDRGKLDHDLLEKRLQSLISIAAKAKPADRNSSEADAREIATELARIEVPIAPQLLADDATPEAVAGLLADQGGRIAIVSAEGGLFDIIAGRYSDKGVNIDVYLKGYSGDSLRVNRRSRGPEHVARPALTIVLTVQPDVINGLAENQAFRSRGLLARFLYSMPVSKVGFRETNPPSTHPEVRENWRVMLTSIANLPYPTDTNSDRPLIYLSADADALFQSYREEVEAAMRPGGELDDMQDWGNKLNGSVARLAGLLHIASRIDHTDKPWEVAVSWKTMTHAIALGNYFKGHAKAAFAAMGADPRIASAKKAWASIFRQGCEEFSVRDLYQNVKGSRFKTVPELEKALDLLIELGYIREIHIPRRDGPGQPPSLRYEVNPLTHPQNTQNTQNREPVAVPVVTDTESVELSLTAGEV